jgi:hypothetical protein
MANWGDKPRDRQYSATRRGRPSRYPGLGKYEQERIGPEQRERLLAEYAERLRLASVDELLAGGKRGKQPDCAADQGLVQDGV